jgi:hypothetical protein
MAQSRVGNIQYHALDITQHDTWFSPSASMYALHWFFPIYVCLHHIRYFPIHTYIYIYIYICACSSLSRGHTSSLSSYSFLVSFPYIHLYLFFPFVSVRVFIQNKRTHLQYTNLQIY